jgi:hypothetical protein
MKLAICVFFSFIFSQAFSQSYFDIFNFTYTTTPANDFEVYDAQTSVEELALEFNFPVVINEESILFTGLFANKTNLNFDASRPSANLNVLGLKVGLNRTFNDKWSGTFLLFTKIASDKITFSQDNLQYAFLSLFTNKKRADLKYRYGIYANTEKYGIILVPVIGLYYKSENQKFEADMNLPIIAEMNYKVYEKAWVGLRFDGLGTTYNLNDQSYSANGAYVSKTSNELLSYFRYRLSKSIYINTKVGYAVSRNYKVFDANDKIDLAVTSFYFGDNRTQLNSRFKDGAIFKVELMYRLHFD